MRPIHIIPAILLIGMALIICTANGQTYNKEVVLLSDMTDAEGLQPEMDIIREHFHFKKDPWSGIRFTYLAITDLRLNREQRVTLPKKNVWFSNQLDRNREVKEFLTEFDRISAEQRTAPKGRGYSSVYLPLAKQLNALANTKVDERILIVYSDLMEHGDISFYDPKTFTTLKDDPTRIISLFQRQQMLSDLKGVTVYLVYRPLELKQDHQFSVTSKLYKQMLEKRGAKVIIQAGLNFTQ
ncbi:MAG: hypothetical protein K9J17_15940 [Flavobacteriales bacterium]|nr:hypothetical protein [Flavobacteriales bacterium]